MEKTLGIGESAAFGELEVRLREIVIEEIAPSRDGAYPAGSGISVILALKKGDKSAEMSLNRLSEGYESKVSDEWNGFRIRLLRVDEKKARLRIE